MCGETRHDEFGWKPSAAATETEIRKRLSTLTDERNDADKHVAEDLLWHDTLVAIAEGVEDPQALARLALLSLEIHFSRWYE